MLTNILSEAGDDGEDGLDVVGDVGDLPQCVEHRPSNHLPARVHISAQSSSEEVYSFQERFDV